MKDRPRSSSLRVQILSRTLIVSLVPLVVLAGLALFSLQKLSSSAEESIARTSALLAEDDLASASHTALVELTDDLDRAGRRLSLVVVAVLVLGGALGSAVGALLARRIVGPIIALTDRASELAGPGLPAAVDQLIEAQLHRSGPRTMMEVDVDNELADLADAVNSVQDAALRFAGEQASQRRRALGTFASLGRRNQALVEQQLSFIDELEQAEDDPDRLAALLELDHLATRLRRSIESLLVISGTTSSSPRIWAVELELVVKGGLSEVGHFDRIDVAGFGPAALLGPVVGDAAHIVAELVDNALAFSDQDLRVQVLGTAGPLHYSIRVVDRGIGMTEEALTKANAVLRRGTAVGINAPEQIGLTVVSRLAAIHGIDVSLSMAGPQGIEARIEIPNHLLEPAAVVTGPPDDSNQRVDEDTLRLGRSRPVAELRPRPIPPQHRAPGPAPRRAVTDPLKWSTDAPGEPPPATNDTATGVGTQPSPATHDAVDGGRSPQPRP